VSVKKVVVGCYTPGDYEREAHERLIPSVRALGLEHDIRQIPSRGSWILNNSACQIFLLGIAKEYPDAHLLYIDVDGMVRSDPWPYLLNLNCDIGVHYMNHGRVVRRLVEELLCGTVYLPPTSYRVNLLERWVAENEKHPDVWDQRNLQNMIDRDRDIRVARLPAEYCCIFDTHRRRYPHIVPVIEHFQASRRYKRRADAQCVTQTTP